MIYWVLLAFSFAFYLVAQLGTTMSPVLEIHSVDENKKIKKYFIFITIFMIVLVGFRDASVGIDTERYYDSYIASAIRDFSDIIQSDVNDKGYVLLQILFNKLGIGLLGFNVIYAAFSFSVISLLIYKYSKMPWLSYFLYFCFSFYLLAFTMVRQTLAMSIIVLAFLTDKNKGFWSFVKFAVLVYIAHTIHASAIVAMPLWFVRKIKFNKNIAILIFILAFLAYVFKAQLANFIINYAANISDKYEGYAEEIQKGNAGILLYMMTVVSVVFGFMLKTFLSEKDNAFFFYCLCIMVLIFPAVQSGGAIMRIYYYFYIFMIVYIPNMLESIQKDEHFYVKLFILMLYIGVGIYSLRSNLLHDTYGIMPYKFFSGVN